MGLFGTDITKSLSQDDLQLAEVAIIFSKFHGGSLSGAAADELRSKIQSKKTFSKSDLKALAGCFRYMASRNGQDVQLDKAKTLALADRIEKL